MNIHQIFTLALKERLLASALADALCSPLVVADPFLRLVGEFQRDFLIQYHHLPQSNDWSLWLDHLPAMQSAGVRPLLGRLLAASAEGYTADFTVQHLAADLKQIATTNAVSRFNEAGGNLDPNLLKSTAEEIEAIRAVDLGEVARLEEVDRWILSPPQESLRPTGIDGLDRMLDGGTGEELVMLMADSGVGKTTALSNISIASALFGAKVLYVTYEISTHKLIHRHYRRIASATQGELRGDPKAVGERVRYWLRYAKGSIRVLFQEAYTQDAEELRTLCRRFADEEGGLDVLIIDYLDLMKPPPGTGKMSEYQQLGRSAHMVRNMKDEFHNTIWTATQSVRGADAARPRLKDMGDSYNKVRAADDIFALVQTEEEYNAHQGRLCALKVRDNPGKGREIPLYINMDLMMIADLDHPKTIATMREHGHLPGENAAA